MKKFLIIATLLLLTGCSATINTAQLPYQAQNYNKVNASVVLGDFTYLPAEQGRLKESEIENTAVGTLYLERSIADIAKQVTAKELVQSGVTLGQGNIKILGKVKELKMDDLGYSIDYSYIINYQILKNNMPVWSEDYRPNKVTTSKFTVTIHEIIAQIYRMMGAGYEKFITDENVKRILESK
ncbi:hypothetical protein [Actinobacillus capsulatus]|uniref:hypothetical protein n=1 Tax=Actinobacillus capsulatus TaxID=717 RepID=UPI00037B83AD|nr:hypothetical protein [Actinobacillus capsulatus]